MAGRFGKYGEHKRLKRLDRGRRQRSGQLRADRIVRRRQDGMLPPCRTVSSASLAKTYKTAVVAIPPEGSWAPIQGLRRNYDRHFRRWMPHITLLYPVRPQGSFDAFVPQLARACQAVTPFDVRLERMEVLVHSRRSATVYLAPEPAVTIGQLQTALWRVAPDCDDVRRFSSGFTPHLSVGQTRAKLAGQWCESWQSAWKPMVFTLAHVYLIWRNDPPDDCFRIGPVLSLGDRGPGAR